MNFKHSFFPEMSHAELNGIYILYKMGIRRNRSNIIYLNIQIQDSNMTVRSCYPLIKWRFPGGTCTHIYRVQ